jgi:hypothetical protein
MPQPADGQGFKSQGFQSQDENFLGNGALSAAVTDSLSTAERLKELRRTFPDMPLAERVAALAALNRR